MIEESDTSRGKAINSVQEDSWQPQFFVEQIEKSAIPFEKMTFEKSDFLFKEGTIPKGVYCLQKGKMKIISLGEEGKEQIIHFAKEGEIVGFRAVLSKELYSVSAIALEQCTVSFIKQSDFNSLIQTNESLRNNLLKELSKELTTQAKFITTLAQKSVKSRLANALVLLHDIYGKEPINLSREDLANFVGTATESLIRLVSEFKNEGLILTNARKITLKNEQKLREIAGK